MSEPLHLEADFDLGKMAQFPEYAGAAARLMTEGIKQKVDRIIEHAVAMTDHYDPRARGWALVVIPAPVITTGTHAYAFLSALNLVTVWVETDPPVVYHERLAS